MEKARNKIRSEGWGWITLGYCKEFELVLNETVSH